MFHLRAAKALTSACTLICSDNTKWIYDLIYHLIKKLKGKKKCKLKIADGEIHSKMFLKREGRNKRKSYSRDS